MPLARLTVENYRSFAAAAALELRPLTLVFGRNSVGKSALLRAFPLLAESARTSRVSPIALSSPIARKAQFSDIRSRLTGRPWMRFRLDFAAPHEGLSFDFRVSDRLGADQQVLEEFSIRQGARELVATWNPEVRPGVEHSLVFTDADAGSRAVTSGRLNPFFRPLFTDTIVPSEEIKLLCSTLRSALDQFAERCQWIGAVRASPERSFERAPERPTRFEADGSSALQLLAHEAFNSATVAPFVQAVDRWFADHLGHHVRVEPVARTNLFQVKVRTREGAVEVDLCDTGEGLAQVLPVVIALREAVERAAEGPYLLALEQPELHLHLDAQHAITELLCEAIRGDRPPTLVVETHSESMLVALQLLLVQGKLPPEKVLVYVVRQDAEGGSYADRVTFDADGYPDAAWDSEMFQDVVSRARDLDRLRVARLRA